MSWPRSAPFAIVGLLSAVPVLGQTLVPRVNTMRATAQAGQDTRMFNYSSWNADCSPRPVPQVAMLAPPGHGSVSVRPGRSTVSVLREGAPDCTGHSFPASTVWYQPAPGFHGTDQFTVSVTSARGVAQDTFVVEVR